MVLASLVAPLPKPMGAQVVIETKAAPHAFPACN